MVPADPDHPFLLWVLRDPSVRVDPDRPVDPSIPAVQDSPAILQGPPRPAVLADRDSPAGLEDRGALAYSRRGLEVLAGPMSLLVRKDLSDPAVLADPVDQHPAVLERQLDPEGLEVPVVPGDLVGQVDLPAREVLAGPEVPAVRNFG